MKFIRKAWATWAEYREHRQQQSLRRYMAKQNRILNHSCKRDGV